MWSLISPRIFRTAAPGSALQTGQVVLPELLGTGPRPLIAADAVDVVLTPTQLDPADLATDGLGQLGELDAPDPLVRREVLTRIAEDRRRRCGRRLVSGGEGDVCLGHR